MVEKIKIKVKKRLVDFTVEKVIVFGGGYLVTIEEKQEKKQMKFNSYGISLQTGGVIEGQGRGQMWLYVTAITDIDTTDMLIAKGKGIAYIIAQDELKKVVGEKPFERVIEAKEVTEKNIELVLEEYDYHKHFLDGEIREYPIKIEFE